VLESEPKPVMRKYWCSAWWWWSTHQATA